MILPPRVKVCCIASVEEARMAVAQGAAALGLVSRMPSGPGAIPEERIAEIAAAVPPPVATFLLTALRTAEAIARQHARCGTTTLQLVDAVAPGERRRLRRLLPHVKVVQVVHVRDGSSLDEAREAAETADALLLDSGHPRAVVKELGGTGRTHDWEISRRIREAVAVPVFLAGGLRATNVQAAIQVVRPFGVDLCTGVRTAGALDVDKLAAFLRAVRDAPGKGSGDEDLEIDGPTRR